MAMNDHHNESSTYLSASNARRPSSRHRRNSDSSSQCGCDHQQQGLEDSSSHHSTGDMGMNTGSSRTFSDSLSQSILLGCPSRLDEVKIHPSEVEDGAPGSCSSTDASAISRQSSSGKDDAAADATKILSSEKGAYDKGESESEKEEEEEEEENNTSRGSTNLSQSPIASSDMTTPRRLKPDSTTTTSDLIALKQLLDVSLNGSNHNKTSTLSPSTPPRAPRRDRSKSPHRERSKSPFRRIRSTPDTSPTRLRNSKGQTIRNFINNDEDRSESTSNSLSPNRTLSPLRRSGSGDAVVQSAFLENRKAEGTLTKADLSPRIPLNRRRGGGGLSNTIHGLRASDLAHQTTRMPPPPNINIQSRGRSLGSVPVSATTKKRTEALQSLAASRSPSTDREERLCASKQLQRGPSRGLLSRRTSFRNLMGGGGGGEKDSNSSGDRRALSRRTSFRNLMGGGGGGGGGDKDSNSSGDRRALSRQGSFRNLMSGESTIEMVGRGIRATKSVADLSAMRKSLAGSSSKARTETKSTEAEPDPLFMEMVQWNPTSPDDRAKFDDADVRRVIKRNPDSLKAKYNVQVGRSTVRRSPLSTMVALGASLETVKAAIKAYPDALKATGTLRSTPLHSACSNNTDMLVVRYIYHKYPEAIKKTTKHVFLPLHNACQMTSPSMEMIQFLVESYPEGLTEINKLGDTPLRTAQRNSTTAKSVLEYLEEETERVFSQNAENEIKRKEVMMRQMWGSYSSEPLGKDTLQGQLDDTDHTTISTAQMDQSEHSTSEEFSSEFAHQSLPFMSL